MSLSDQVKEAGIGNNGFFKFVNKETCKFRILSEPKLIAQHFFGKGNKPSVCYGENNGCPFHGDNSPKDEKGNEKSPSVKFVTYVLDKSDNKVKIADLPYTVIKKIDSWEKDEDFGFKGYPMPYDIKLAYDKDKSPTEMYDVNASPKREPVTDEVLGEVAGKMAKFSPAQMVEKKKSAQMEEHKSSGIWLSPEQLAEERAERLKDLPTIHVDADDPEYPKNDGEEIPF